MGCLTFIRPELDLPSYFPVLGIAGIYLLWEMIRSLHFKSTIPVNYEKISIESYSVLHESVISVTNDLNMGLPDAVYVTEGIDAAVFCRPTMLSVFKRPKQELVIGKLLLDILSENELKTILYHEFGHYSKGSLGKKIPTYMVAQFSKSFTAVKKMKQGMWNNMINSQIALFSYFAFWICTNIDGHYKHLSQYEEYAADDVARNHVGDTMLAVVLVKMAVLSYNLKYLLWTTRQLEVKQSIVPQVVISLLCRYNRPKKDAILPSRIKLRIERLNASQDLDGCVGLLKNCVEACPESLRLTKLLLRLHGRYAEAIERNTSVTLKIHLDRKKHRLPLVEGKYRILLDGRPIGTGNFIRGLDLTIKTCPGKHIVESYAITGIKAIPFEFNCERDAQYLLNMDFRRHLRNGYYDVYVESAKKIIG